mmetsp:Transcript_23798/g.34894  ORF Transcript_23798/g.34894 Transcript_23798/m.34894 type:complete len:984 (+) Transcript_23798:319-3270(+)|eukprot:CAMPEP_0185032728 /NCGR_PEP_ID=MMETSP1103-20130426/21047_1 /TAXON_ID=36769 /ORGANISM="Paraphysomonas bandaiensis, Strain Caron Lab Isolate" /LENGTH=983 /DNA_ID=CAMNT_0027568721 /DNA_START=271 /DNA_END=3222 /DNA_ORIENTATION=+
MQDSTSNTQEMYLDLINKLRTTHAFSKEVVVNKKNCHSLDEKILGLIPAVQKLLDEDIVISPRSYHRLITVLANVESFFKKSFTKSWANTFKKNSMQTEYTNIMNSLNSIVADEPNLTPVDSPVEVNTPSKITKQWSSPAKSDSNGASSETIESTMHSVTSGLQHKNESAVASGLGAMAAVSGAGSTVQALFGQKGACALVHKAMLAYPKSATIAENGCTIVKNLVGCTDNVVRLCEGQGGGACGAVVNLFESNVRHTAVVREAVAAITRMAAADELLNDELIAHGAGRVLVQSMEVHLGEENVCELVCGALEELGHDFLLLSNNSDWEEHICEVVVKVLTVHHNLENLVKSACWALMNLSREHRLGDALDRAGASKALVKTMEQHAHNVDIMELALGSIIFLCDNNDDISDSFGSAGIAFALGDVFGRHKHIPIMAEMGCLAVIHLTQNDHYHNVAALGTTPLCSSLVTVIRDYHEKHMSIAQTALVALRNLSHSSAKNGQVFERFGCCSIVIGAMQLYMDCEAEFTEKCVLAIFSLSKHVENLSKFVDLGAFSLVVSTVVNFIDDEEVVEAACLTISRFLAYFSSMETDFVERSLDSIVRIHDVFVSAFLAHHSNELVAEHCCRILSDIILRNECAEVAVSDWSNASVAVVTGLSSCFSHFRAAQWCCRTIKLLVEETENCATCIGAAGGCAAIVEALRLHHHSPAYVGTACAAILSLCAHVNDSKEAFVVCGVGEVLGSVLEFLSSSSALVNAQWKLAVARACDCVVIFADICFDKFICKVHTIVKLYGDVAPISDDGAAATSDEMEIEEEIDCVDSLFFIARIRCCDAIVSLIGEGRHHEIAVFGDIDLPMVIIEELIKTCAQCEDDEEQVELQKKLINVSAKVISSYFRSSNYTERIHHGEESRCLELSLQLLSKIPSCVGAASILVNVVERIKDTGGKEMLRAIPQAEEILKTALSHLDQSSCDFGDGIVIESLKCL